MHDVVFVRVFECGADLDGDFDYAREICWTRLRETWTTDQFHYEKWEPA